jgi:protein tyrosine phosphatase (PTP) superfamily phosphohydrolase (DUF442 family)
MQPMGIEPSDSGPLARPSERERSDLELQRDAMVNEGGGTIDRQVPVPAPLLGLVDVKPARRGLIWRLFHRRERVRSLEVRWFDGEIAFGRSPTVAELERLARRHHLRSLLNLNTEGEVGEVMSPNVEASWAETFELAHRRVSIDTALLKPEDADRFLDELRRIEKPVYVHSHHGRRAAAFLILWLGVEHQRTGNETLAEARELGLECESDALREFCLSVVNKRFAARAMQRMSAAAQV